MYDSLTKLSNYFTEKKKFSDNSLKSILQNQIRKPGRKKNLPGFEP